MDDSHGLRSPTRKCSSHDERRASLPGDSVDEVVDLGGDRPALRDDPLGDGRRGTLADLGAVREVDPAHASGGGEVVEHRALAGEGLCRAVLVDPAVDAAEVHDRPTLWRLVGERRQVGDLGEGGPFDVRAGDRQEVASLAVAERDRPGLVEQERGHVTGCFDGPPRHREDVALDESVHAGDADRREQRADRRRDEAHEQGDQHDDRL